MTERKTVSEEEIASDDYMRSLGFVEMTSEESMECERFFKCAAASLPAAKVCKVCNSPVVDGGENP